MTRRSTLSPLNGDSSSDLSQQRVSPTLRPLILLAWSLITIAPRTLHAQADTLGVGAAVSRARDALEGLGALWHADAAGIHWLFVSPSTALRTRGANALESVSLPTGAPRANMSYTLGSDRLAMIVLPLGDDVEANARLLVHEAMHTLQPQHLPHPGNTEPMDGGDLLDRADGRTWLFLELRALAVALANEGAARITAAHDALAFRAHRDQRATLVERTRLDALDLAEGIPEYTGWRLVNSAPEMFVPRLEGARDRRVSWVRAVGYYTGPAYGYLLDAFRTSGWHARWRAGARLPDLLRDAVGADPSRSPVEERAMRYGGGPIISGELARDAERLRTTDSLRTRYLRHAVLRIIPSAMQVTFDPNRQVPLDNHGTVMHNFRWASTDGAELSAPAGALVSPTWTHVQVPLGAATIAEGVVTVPVKVTGDGWQLTLPRGWVVTRTGLVTEVRPPSR